MDEDDDDLPAGIGKPAFQALKATGFARLDQFTRVTQDDLLKLHGVGPRAVRILRGALDARGLSFKDPD
jgi:hypothetical protein